MSKNKTNKKVHYNNGDFLQQYLLLLDLWQQPYSSIEFCNQLIEGDTIDLLFWLYIDHNEEEVATGGGKKEDKKQLLSNFNCKTFSFNLLYKLSKENDCCRAEVGRVGGIKKLLNLIKNDDKNEKLIELLCLTCKEAVNRHRFKEQNLLCELIGLLKRNLYETKRSICTQKLINSICSFTHDQDSLSYFLQNSLCDCFIDYLNNELNLSSDQDQEVFSFNELQVNKCEHKTNECSLNKNYNLNEILLTSNQLNRSASAPSITTTGTNKRKLDNYYSTTTTTTSIQQQIKRTKYSYSPNIFLPPPPPPLLSPTASNDYDFIPISPTASTFSLSPPNFTSSSPPPTLAYSPTTSFSSSPALSFNRSNSEKNFDNEINDKIKFSPSIADSETLGDEVATNYSSSCCSKLSNTIFDAIFPPLPTTASTSKQSCFTDSTTATTATTNTNIEIINRTEACIFYVFSILSHGDQPSNYILNDKFFTFLLNYLKLSKHTKNPRALRILNRLTKNPQCFQYFILNEFSYKIKFKFNILFNDDEESGNSSKDVQFYLSSNKVFFDSNIFPKFSSIESLINQNLKQQCLTSSDFCYQNLLNLIKYGTQKEKQACALQMPFILRNCKAMENIMLQMNCLDLILDSIFDENIDENLFYKSLFCIRKLIKFVNYKYNLKQMRDDYEQYKNKLQKIYESYSSPVDNSNEIEFLIDDNKSIKADKLILSDKCDYFSLLLNGNFLHKQKIPA